MRVNERFEVLEDKIRQLEKEVFELKKAAGVHSEMDVPAADEPKEAGTAKKARTTRAKKTTTK